MARAPKKPDTAPVDDHWLVRPGTIRKIWIGGILVLAVTVALELFTGTAGHFHGVDEWFAFPAVFGFLGCVAMVFVAKVLGFILKRKDDYYDL